MTAFWQTVATLFPDGRIWILTVSPDDWVAAENEADQRRFQPFVSALAEVDQ
jgi:hypothetical protein